MMKFILAVGGLGLGIKRSLFSYDLITPKLYQCAFRAPTGHFSKCACVSAQATHPPKPKGLHSRSCAGPLVQNRLRIEGSEAPLQSCCSSSAKPRMLLSCPKSYAKLPNPSEIHRHAIMPELRHYRSVNTLQCCCPTLLA